MNNTYPQQVAALRAELREEQAAAYKRELHELVQQELITELRSELKAREESAEMAQLAADQWRKEWEGLANRVALQHNKFVAELAAIKQLNPGIKMPTEQEF